MKHIETNFLIYDLAKKCNTKTRVSAFKFIFLTFAISVIFIMIYLLNNQLRHNLSEMINTPVMNIFYLQLVIFSVTSFLGCYLSYKQSIPGQTESVFFKLLNVTFYMFWLVLFSVMGLLSLNDYSVHAIIKCDWICIERALIGLTVPLAAMFYLMKKGYVINSIQSITTVCLTAFSFASFLNLFICPETSPLYIFCSHNLVILPVILLFIIMNKLLKK